MRGAVVGVAVLGLAACGGTVDAGSGSGAGDGEQDGLVRDVAADAPLLQVHRAGGFMMPGYDFAAVPALTVYEDGRVITQGPQIEIFPGPLLPNLLVGDLTDDEVDAIVAAARDAGLLAEAPDYGQPPVADVPTTYVTLTVDGESYVHAANALDMFVDAGVDGGSDEMGQPQEIGLTPEQLEARTVLNEFLAEVEGVVPMGDGEPYDITAFAVAGRAAEGGAPADPELGPQVVPWPLEQVALADLGCVVVDGDDAATLRDALAEANQLTQFDQGGTTYEVWFRPLLPHESECPDGV
ncbi:hypothetical protein N866_08395 [Actinotalea ferrariae CF5-4]|uniref:Uncharacterized protein n=1 Tax=Actinotalea ferrariae CF5-4 TaxID=948458 RepID=A0A021VTU3_9CELL|nr:hypothetical protein N866_08395 [Actinotalea ferrariae CF5-4]